MQEKNVFITGANRGIGFAFCQHYLAAGHHVWACHRQEKNKLSGISNDRLHLLEWDVTQPVSDAVLKQIPYQIDLLINNAGIYGPNNQQLESVTADEMAELFMVNSIAPLMVVQQLKGRLSKGSVIANLSSRMGSTEDNGSGGCYGYRASKAALVIISKSMAVDLQSSGIEVITLHPGWVRTDMTGNTGEIDVEESVRGMTTIISNINQYLPAAFVAWDGEILPY